MSTHAMTVLGPVDPDELGLVLAHEHLLHGACDHPAWFEPEPGARGRRLAEGPVTMDVLGALRRNPFASRANNQLTREDPLDHELELFRQAGGGTIVDLTSRGLQPDPEGLRELAQRTGVNVVAGCGWYVDHALPEDFARRSVEELAAGIVSDLREGIDGTDVRAGIIGEIGTSPRLQPNEERSLRAAGMAGAETGAAVSVHLPGVGRTAFEVFDVLVGEGVAPDRIVMNHMDCAEDIAYCKAVADLGCVVSYDTFGSEGHFDSWRPVRAGDSGRIAGVLELVEAGHAERVTLSHGVFHKHRLVHYGGWGFEHIPHSVVPQLRAAGLRQGELDQILVHTPRRLLCLPDR